MRVSVKKTILFFVLFVMTTGLLLAQNPEAPAVAISEKYISYLLIGGIIIEEIFILILAGILVKVARVSLNMKKNTQNAAVAAFLLLSSASFANAAPEYNLSYAFLNTSLLWIAVILAFVILAQLVLIWMFVHAMQTSKKEESSEKGYFEQWWEKINALVPKDKEKDILMDHNFDGIQELNNFMPPWLQYFFIVTVVWSPIYLWYYHFGGGMLMEEEYYSEVKAANVELEKRMSQNQTVIDENSVKLSLNAGDIAEGKALFVSKTCASCHGENAQGAVGPNLIDDYWIHGGTAKEIFLTIKNGKTDKGMPAWKESMSGKQMMQVISYVKSLKGQTFPNAKEPQGNLFKEEAIVNDSTVTDSAKAK